MISSAAFLFALVAGLSMATYTVCLRLASPGIHPVLGAAIVTGAAFAVNLSLALAMKATGTSMAATSRSVYLVVIVGVAAACADLFTLSAYARGLQITSSFIIGGTTAVLVLGVGFLVLREPFTWLRLLAVALILAGVFLLQREGV